MNHKEDLIAGRNAVIEALRAKKPIDKIFVLDGCQDGPIRTIVREAKKTDAILKFVDKERLNQLTIIYGTNTQQIHPMQNRSLRSCIVSSVVFIDQMCHLHMINHTSIRFSIV